MAAIDRRDHPGRREADTVTPRTERLRGGGLRDPIPGEDGSGLTLQARGLALPSDRSRWDWAAMTPRPRAPKTTAPTTSPAGALSSPRRAPASPGAAWTGKTDPFEDLTCDAMTMMLLPTRWMSAGCSRTKWRTTPSAMDLEAGSGVRGRRERDDMRTRCVMWRAPAREGGGAADDRGTVGKVFKTVWFDDDLDGKIKNSNDASSGRRGPMHDSLQPERRDRRRQRQPRE